MTYRTFFLFLVCFGLSACSTGEVDLRATSDYRIEVAFAETQEAIPTSTAYPTTTPYATQTVYPSATFAVTTTPYPTYTAYPSATLYPTFTPLPTATETPIPTATATAMIIIPGAPLPTPMPINQNLYIIQIVSDARRALLDFGGAISSALQNNDQLDCQPITTHFSAIANAPTTDISGSDVSFQAVYNLYREEIEKLSVPGPVSDLAQQCNEHIANGMVIVPVDYYHMLNVLSQSNGAANKLSEALHTVGAE